MKETKNIAVIFAGGVGKRMGPAAKPKQFLIVEDKPVIIHTLEYFEQHPKIDAVYIACVGDWIAHLEKLIAEFELKKIVKVVPGGDSALDSIYRGLSAAANDCAGDSAVLIHDGVRPFITPNLINELLASVSEKGNGITCTPCFETILISEDGKQVGEVPLRQNTYAAQAPQAFLLGEIIEAHEAIRKGNPTYETIVDCCTLYRQLGRAVYMVPGNVGNIKITKPEDVYILKGLLQFRESEEIMGLPLS